jgi:putative surface-exposed virulence protein
MASAIRRSPTVETAYAPVSSPGIAQGVRGDSAGIVTISNDGHIQGYSGSGIEVVAGTTVNITNTSPDTIEGATNGVYVHDVGEANVDNDHGHIIGHDGAGVLIDNITGNVSVKRK